MVGPFQVEEPGCSYQFDFGFNKGDIGTENGYFWVLLIFLIEYDGTRVNCSTRSIVAAIVAVYALIQGN